MAYCTTALPCTGIYVYGAKQRLDLFVIIVAIRNKLNIEITIIYVF